MLVRDRGFSPAFLRSESKFCWGSWENYADQIKCKINILKYVTKCGHVAFIMLYIFMNTLKYKNVLLFNASFQNSITIDKKFQYGKFCT